MTLRDDILQDIAEDIVAQIQHEIVSDHLVFSRKLFENWEITKDGDGEYTIGSPLIYAKIMDEGRLPGSMPPLSALFPWVRDKIPTKSAEEAKSIAFAVAKSIAEKGIEPRHYIRSALFQMEKGSQ